MKKILMALILTQATCAFAVVEEFQGYNVVSRYKELEDKFTTYEMLTPYGHDFILDLQVYANKNILDLVGDVKDIKGDTTNEKIAAAEEVLLKYENTEQTARFKALIGVPLPSFTVKGVQVVPDIRIGANWGANVGIRSDYVDVDDILAFVGEDLPSDLVALIEANKSVINTNLAAANGDIIQALIASGVLSPSEQAVAETYKDTFFMPTTAGKVPVLHLYTKMDAVAGFNFNFFKNRWYGAFDIYGLYRTDYLKRITAESIANNDDLFADAKNLNSTLYLTTDLSAGYRTNRYSIMASVEELKLSTLSDNKDKAGEVIYGMDPLYRLHADMLFKMGVVSVQPFTGLHYRSAYDLVDGLYVGADWGIHFWKDRLGLRLRTMADNEHITLAPKLKFGIGHLEYMLKVPHVSEKDGVKPSAIHSVNFRLFF